MSVRPGKRFIAIACLLLSGWVATGARRLGGRKKLIGS